jgi:hypothetical protein
MSYRAIMFIAALAAAAPLAAQDAAVVVDPGMTRAEVIDRLGKPLNERKSGDHTYLFYRNGCEKTCGMNDLVVLDDGKVSDAIFRSPGRRYSGTSSSPAGVKPSRSKSEARGDSAVATVRRARRGGLVIAKPADGAAPATVTGVQVVPAEGSAPNGGLVAAPEAGTGTSGVGTGGGGTAGGNAPQVTAPGGNSPQVGSPEPQPVRQGPVGANGKRAILPVPLPGAKVNPADSVRALTPDRPTPLPGAKLNPADSVRAEQIRRQLADTSRKP